MNPSPTARFVDVPGPRATDWENEAWPPLVVTRAEIENETARLAAADATGPRGTTRRSLIAHPSAVPPGLGLAPGIQVALEVLRPGERTPPARHTSSVISFCIAGGGEVSIDGDRTPFGRYDTWYVPALRTYAHHNPTDQLQVRLVYSNAAVLEKLGVHWVDPEPAEGRVPDLGDRRATAAEPVLRDLGTGAYLMGYEDLINPPPLEQPALHWPWEAVRKALDDLGGLDGSYNGRRLFLLYNPATGRTNGTSPALFATITIRPPDIVDRPHRHAAAAINYFFEGSGWSRIAGRRYTWEAGDLMFTAPGWAIHNHASGPAPVYEITIQDFPLHLAMDSLLWQEDLKHPPILLGSHPAFRTNRAG
jgi:gentisate 1,2-dioxygenase